MNKNDTDKVYKAFEKKVIKSAEGCWGWNGNVQEGKTPHIATSTSPIGIHRVSWMLYKGILGDNAFIKRACKNKQCSKPTHLELSSAPHVKKQSKKRSLKKVLLDMDESVHRMVKIHAARRNMTMRGYILQSLVNRLKFEETFEKE